MLLRILLPEHLLTVPLIIIFFAVVWGLVAAAARVVLGLFGGVEIASGPQFLRSLVVQVFELLVVKLVSKIILARRVKVGLRWVLVICHFRNRIKSLLVKRYVVVLDVVGGRMRQLVASLAALPVCAPIVSAGHAASAALVVASEALLVEWRRHQHRAERS